MLNMIKRKIKVLYHNKDYKFEQHGEFIDLATSVEYSLQRDEYRTLDLGVSMQFPKWYGAMVLPRSSSCKNWGLIQANSVGLIDNSYNGVNDRWKMPVISRYMVVLPKNTRVCQFRPLLNHNAPWYIKILDLFTTFEFKEVDVLYGEDRGGIGSTNK